MAYPYNPKIAPAIGNGLGGFPQKASGGTTAVVVPRGEIIFYVPGTYTWTPPAGVTSVCVVCVGGGSKLNGGALAYVNNIPVVYGTNYTVVVGNRGGESSHGGTSYFKDTSTVAAGGGKFDSLTGGSVIAGTGGAGGTGSGSVLAASGGGGAGGYAGTGGTGGYAADGTSGTGGAGGGGGGDGNGGGGGGGVGLFGQGSNGAGAGASTFNGGGGGSGGETGGNSTNFGAFGGNFGGGGGRLTYSSRYAAGGGGAVRIIWGKDRAFPSTDCGQS